METSRLLRISIGKRNERVERVFASVWRLAKMPRAYDYFLSPMEMRPTCQPRSSLLVRLDAEAVLRFSSSFATAPLPWLRGNRHRRLLTSRNLRRHGSFDSGTAPCPSLYRKN